MVSSSVMGNSEEVKASKPEKTSPDHNKVHVYPDWAAMQAYYGARLAVPPYLNSGVASPHTPPPYMWGPPQSMMPPPYGSPYAAAAFYAPGGVYTHPGIPMAGSTINMENPVKSLGNGDGSFVKKLKEFDGHAMSTGNGTVTVSGEHGSDRRLTESEGTEDSSDGSNGLTTGVFKNGKRSRQDSLSSADRKHKKSSTIPGVSRGSGKSVDVTTTPSDANLSKKIVEKQLSTSLSLNKEPSDTSAKSIPMNALRPSMATGETWLQSEKELKRERRKQSNRESARRSRLRKQAEAEELSVKVQVLAAENMALKSERNILIESSEKLRLENAKLMEKLGNTQLAKTHVKLDNNIRVKPIATVNLLARVNNPDCNDRSNENGDSYEDPNSGAKLRQLLNASPRTDAVAAS